MTKQKLICGAIRALLLGFIVMQGIAQTNQDPPPRLEAISWKNVSNFSSGVLSIADTGSSLLVGAGSKIHRSTDGGNTWTESNTGNTITAPTGFAVLGTKVFVAGTNLIEVSTNDGQSWAKAADLIGANQLAVYNNVLYATTLAGQGLYRSTDGATWTRIYQPTTSISLTSFAAMDGALVVASDTAGLYRSVDNGATWTSVKTGACSGVSASGNAFYASFGDGVYRSRDKGANWLRTNLYSLSAASRPAVNGNQIFVRNASSPEDIAYSPNEGYYWTSATTPTSFISTIFFKPGTILVGTILGSLYLGTQLDTLPTAPTGGYWENVASIRTATGNGTNRPLQLYAFGSNFLVYNNNKLLRSTNFGLSWEDKTPANARLNNTDQNGTQLAAGSKYIFMASESGVYRSADNGSTWQFANTGLGTVTSCKWVFAKDETIFTYASSRFFRTVDSGANWTEIPSGVSRNPDGMAAVGTNFLRFDRDGAVNKSTDNGVTWTKLTTTGLPTPVVSSDISSFSSIVASGGTIFVNFRNSTQAGVYKSTDEGQTWARVTTTVAGKTNPPIAGNLLYDGKNLLLITEGGKNTLGTTTYDVHLSTDAGQNYTRLNANSINFTNYDSIAIAAIGSKVFQVNASQDFWVGTGSIITPQTTVSAASYMADSATAEGIASAFGNGITIFTESATAIPLPTTLGDVQVKVKDSAGVERIAGLFYVSPMQVNYQIPAGTAPGTAMITVMSANGATIANGNVTVSNVAPGLFTFNMDGAGVPAAVIQRISAGGAMAYEQLGQKDGTGRYVPTPIDLGAATDRVYLALFGTGVRGRSNLSKVAVTIGGQASTVEYAGSQNQFVGLDQINVLIPRSLIGKGETDLVLTVDGKTANTVRVNIK